MIGFGPTIAVAIAAAALLIAVVVRKARRDRRERRSRARREALEAARGQALTRLIGACLAGSAAHQGDLLDVLRRAGGALPRYRAATDSALADAVLARATRSRHPAERGRVLLIAAWLLRPGTVDAAAGLLADGDMDVRLAACSALATVRSRAAADALIAALPRGHVPPLRLAERLGAPWAVPAMIAALPSIPAGAPRAACIRALGLAGGRDAVAVIAPYLQSPVTEERISAARTLGGLGDPSSRSPLAAALGDERWEVRAQAATALGEIRDAMCASALAGSLSDKAWWVRANAAHSLARMGAEGTRILRRAEAGPDRYAAERAREELELLEAAVA